MLFMSCRGRPLQRRLFETACSSLGARAGEWQRILSLLRQTRNFQKVFFWLGDHEKKKWLGRGKTLRVLNRNAQWTLFPRIVEAEGPRERGKAIAHPRLCLKVDTGVQNSLSAGRKVALGPWNPPLAAAKTPAPSRSFRQHRQRNHTWLQRATCPTQLLILRRRWEWTTRSGFSRGSRR